MQLPGFLIAIALAGAAASLSACHVPSQAQLEAEGDRLTVSAAGTADQLESEMQAKAAACGSRVVIITDPASGATAVWIDPKATPEQSACVQRELPFAKPIPR